MDIKINKDSLILKKSTIKNLPDFVVITGENGSGKTQLLNAISNSSAFIPGYSIVHKDLDLNAEISHNGELITRINYIPLHGHYFDFGQGFNLETLKNNWGTLPMKYFSFLNLKHSGNILISKEMLLEQFKKDTGFTDSTNQNIIQDSDINLLNKIYDGKLNKDEHTTIQECIINVPIQTNNLFSANLTLLYLQYYCRLELGLTVSESPWQVFNEILEEAKFKYRIQEPDYQPNNYDVSIKLEDLYNGNLIDIHSLSSGERTILSLILALYNSNNIEFPELILFDEPDSSLHPSMSKQMLDVLQNIFVAKKNCRVIITTHSPTTVALAPDLSIYRMDRNSGTLVKESKANGIKSLTSGLENISIYFENRKQIFVESLIDKQFYELSYNNLKRKGILSKNIFLEFITTCDRNEKGDTNGGCTFVKTFVNDLRKSGNNTILGLIDFDNKNNSSDNISILGQSRRYSIENYILDPIFLLLFIILKEEKEKLRLEFNEDEYIIDFGNFTQDKIQYHIDQLVFNFNLFKDDQRVSYVNVKNEEYNIPESWLILKGHDLENEILNKILFLRKYKSDGLCNSILEVVKMFTDYLPVDIVETYLELEKKN